jgi:signal transduction histidine kinase/CheY-like chemotaxis protein/uncharacterized membrane protein (DUF485 family)
MLEKPGQRKKTSDDFQKPSLRERLETDRSLRTRAVIFSLLLYLIVYFLIYYFADRVTAIAGIIPAVTVGWLFGFLPGIFAGILTFPALLVSRAMLEGELWSNSFTMGTAIAGTGAIILNAGIVGRIRDLDVRFRKSLRERKLADAVLMENVKILSTQKTSLQEINIGLEKARTERNKSVLILQETENRLEKLIEISTDPIVICDSQGRALKPNRAFCEMVAFAEKDMIGKPIHSFSLNSPGKYILETGEEICIDEDHFNNTRKKFDQLFDKGTMFNWEAYLVNNNKKIIPTLNNAVCLYDKKGEITNIFFVLRDRTEQRKAERALIASKEEAETANLSKNLFLTNMSHEIRTPMNGVIGFTDILLNSGLDSDQEDYALTIKRSGEALLSLIDDILDFSKIESGKIAVKEIDFDVELLVHDVCELIRPKLSGKNIEILCQIEKDVPSQIKSDPYRFRQVLINLMGNAAKFTKEGEIGLSVDVEDKKENKIKLHVKVRDTGIGIPKDKINSIFEIFHQADNSTTRKYGGTGLGLSISKKIASIMGGNVWAESEPGKGSVFHFTAWVEKAEIKHKKRYENKNFKNKKALIYDSNKSSLKSLSNSLESIEMVVTKIDRTESVIVAIESAAKANTPYDICILDISASDETGFEIAGKIRSSASSNIPIIALSSSIDISAKRCKESGFNGFLPKPVNRIKLHKMIEWLFCEAEQKPLPEDTVNAEIITQYSIRENIKHSISILLAEDNLVNQKLAEKLFTQAGYLVDTVNNGEEAVNMFLSNQNKYDIIFMDIQMPVLNGHEATKMIREKGFKDIPIVAVTANVVKGSREQCLETGMDDYIPKPIKREIIFQTINKWVIEKKAT